MRHGDPIYNPDSLTPLGKRQAEALARRLAVYGVDKIFCSTSNRAYETAVPTSELVKKEIKKMEFFHESVAWSYFGVPNAEGKTQWVELQQSFRNIFASKEVRELGDKWYDYPGFAQYKFKDGVKFYEEKVDEFMLSLGYEHDRERHCYNAVRENDDRIAMFAHGGFGAAFLSSVLDIPYPQFITRTSMTTSGMTVIEFSNKNPDIERLDGEIEVIPQILQYDNDSHLYKEGLPTYHCNRIYI